MIKKSPVKEMFEILYRNRLQNGRRTIILLYLHLFPANILAKH